MQKNFKTLVKIPDNANWVHMTMAEKLEFVKSKLNIDDKELGKMLGVSKVAISYWRNNVKKPRKQHLDKLFRLSQMSEWLGDVYGKDAFLSQFTISYDGVQHVYKDIFDNGDDLSKSNAIHSLCTKFAFVLSQHLKQNNIDPLIHIHSLFGTPDCGEIMNISLPGNTEDVVDLCVKIGEVQNTLNAVYILECISNNNVVHRKLGSVSDKSIAHTVNLILKFLKYDK